MSSPIYNSLGVQTEALADSEHLIFAALYSYQAGVRFRSRPPGLLASNFGNVFTFCDKQM